MKCKIAPWSFLKSPKIIRTDLTLMLEVLGNIIWNYLDPVFQSLWPWRLCSLLVISLSVSLFVLCKTNLNESHIIFKKFNLCSFTQKNVCAKENPLQDPAPRCGLGEWKGGRWMEWWGAGADTKPEPVKRGKGSGLLKTLPFSCFELYKAGHLESSLIFGNLCLIV